MRATRSVTMTVVALAAAMSIDPLASAQPTTEPRTTERRARHSTLWLSHGLAETTDATLRDALARATGESLWTSTDAREQLERLATTLGDDPNDARVQQALRSAHESYVELRLDEARRACDLALERAVASDRAPADPRPIVDALFARALVALASQRTDDANADLLLALTLSPSFAPDPAVYGPPALRAVERARRALGRRVARTLRVSIDRAPEDAIVRLDGRDVPAGAVAMVDRPGPHLLVAERPGYAPRSQWIEVPATGETRAAVVLPRAPRALVARHVLDVSGAETRWSAESDVTRLVAAALEVERVVTAEPAGDAEVALAAYDARTGVATRRARGAIGSSRGDALPPVIAAFVGRATSEREGPRLPGPMLTVTAPSEVRVGGRIALTATLRDPGRTIVALEARCGERRERRAGRTAGDTWHVAFRLRAPLRARRTECRLFAFDGRDRVAIRAPAGPDRLTVRVVEIDGESWLERWYFWAIVGVAAASGAVAGIVAASGEDPTRQVLVVRGPE